MKLSQLLQNVQVLKTAADLNTEITGVCYDSRKVKPGNLFVAVTGFNTDGNRFIPKALELGAAAVVTATEPAGQIPYVLVSSDRMALAQIGANLYGHPAEKLCLIGVTGTNGKTSATLLLKHVLEQVLGVKVGLVGTMENLIGDQVIPTERTTPESLELQELFNKMVDAKCTHAIMEVSSHALALDRVGGLHYDVAAFTNLTEDHLDFHKTMDQYCDAKALLFTRCDKAVVNGDDPYHSRVTAGAKCPVITTSVGGNGDLIAQDLCLKADGVEFTAVFGQEQARVSLPIPASLRSITP